MEERIIRMEVCTRVHGTNIFIPYMRTLSTIDESIFDHELMLQDFAYVRDVPIDFADIARPIRKIAHQDRTKAGRFARDAVDILYYNVEDLPDKCKYARFVSVKPGWAEVDL